MHLEVLSRLSMLLMDDEFRTNLLDAADVTEFLAHIDEAERKKFLKSTEKKTDAGSAGRGIPGTGSYCMSHRDCPHIYGGGKLENKANDVPDSGRIYRHGACGQTGIDAGIVGGLLAKSGMTMAAEEAGWVSSGFFGALIAGFAAGLIMLFKENSGKASKSAGGNKADAFVSVFGNRGNGSLMVFVVNPPVGAFNEWLNQVLASMGESSRVLLGAVLGGMVPPIGIALATLFFKNRFTKSEQQTVATNFIMGLSFITEGAIPFAASDPLLFLAAVAAGSVVAMLGIVLLKKPLAAK